VVKSFNRVDDYLLSNTVLKRRNRAEAARQNGLLGGRPAKPNNPENNQTLETQGTKPNNPRNPPYKEKGKEKNINTPSVGKGVYSEHKQPKSTPQQSPSPLWAVGTPGGSIDKAIWKKYGDHLAPLVDDLDRSRMVKAWRNYWPFPIGAEEDKILTRFLASASDEKIRETVSDIARYLQRGYHRDFEIGIEKFIEDLETNQP
jgi:hypothetical protein